MGPLADIEEEELNATSEDDEEEAEKEKETEEKKDWAAEVEAAAASAPADEAEEDGGEGEVTTEVGKEHLQICDLRAVDCETCTKLGLWDECEGACRCEGARCEKFFMYRYNLPII